MGNHRSYLGHIEEHKRGQTAEPFTMHSLGGFPAITHSPDFPPAPVQVEVYEVDDNTFRHLDGLEGYPRFYNRKEVDINLEDGTMTKAWIYFVEDYTRYSKYPVVESGDWVKYKVG